MPKLTIEQPHSLPIAEAKQRLQTLSDQLATKYGIAAKWTSDREAEIKRTGVTGKIVCAETKVSILLDLSFTLTPLKGTIEERVRAELKKALS